MDSGAAAKGVLRNLPLGSEVAIDEPAGAFTLHRDTGRAAVFLAGGIGVTPFRSMIRQAEHDGVARRLYLFYSNRRPEDAAFLDEFREMAAGNGEFKFVPTVTQAWRSGCEWQGETRYIAPELIVRHVGALQGPMYYLAGPPAMVQSLIQERVDAGVKFLDGVLATGRPVLIHRKGKLLRIVAEPAPDRLQRLKRRPRLLRGDPE
ncbi:MAG TPA: FAD-dependent oxidoreductase [Terriglobales bacterium]|nr:FAD-dependent oxidoreductase [Terriglobales bacterium]